MARAVVLLLVGVSPRHGYDIYESLREHPLASPNIRYVYRMLRGMEADGLVVSEGKMPPTTIRRGGSTS